jgi:hypothetical protein
MQQEVQQEVQSLADIQTDGGRVAQGGLAKRVVVCDVVLGAVFGVVFGVV